jgi:hypothetical protein
MARFLILLGLTILVIGLLWAFLSRIGFGRLPGDIVIERENVTFYFTNARAVKIWPNSCASTQANSRIKRKQRCDKIEKRKHPSSGPSHSM